jgi:hypothetical protein
MPVTLTVVPAPVETEPAAVAIAAEPAAAEPAAAEPVAAEAAPVEVPVAEVDAPVAEVATPARTAARRTAVPGLDGELPFRPWAPKPAGDRKTLDQLADPRTGRLVRRVLLAGVKAEGPVHRDRLTRLAAGAFGLSRVTEARRDALLALLPETVLDGEYAWPEALDRASWSAFRRQPASTIRPLEHVAPEEVGNAMVALCRAATEAGAAPTRDELFARTVEVFGYRRRTPSLAPLLTAALDRLTAAGRLTLHEDGRVTA